LPFRRAPDWSRSWQKYFVSVGLLTKMFDLATAVRVK
jgi:hypothetical protein